MSKDRARPFSRKHRRYWLPVLGTMVLIGTLNVALGYCTYEKPPDDEQFERIVPDVPRVVRRGSAAPVQAATGCDPTIAARVATDLLGGTIVACTPDRVTVMRRDHRIEVEVSGSEIVATAEALALSEIPGPVMRAFAVAYPRTIPASAIKRTRRGAEPTYELAFPDGAPHALAILRPDGSVIELR